MSTMPHRRSDGTVFLGARCGGCYGTGKRQHQVARGWTLRQCPSCDGLGFIDEPIRDASWRPSD